MKSILFSTQKGGVGKTTCTVHGAYYFAERKKKVIAIDVDIQGDTSYSLSYFKAYNIKASDLFTKKITELPKKKVDLAELPPEMGINAELYAENITVIPADELLVDLDQLDLNEVATNFKSNIEFLSSEYDVCFIDSGAAVGHKIVAMMSVIDCLISPIELAKYSINGIERTVRTLSYFKNSINPKLEFLGILPFKVDFGKPRQKRNYEILVNEVPELLAPLKVHNRDAIGEALEEKIPVWRVKKSAARLANQEMKALYEYISEKMNIE
ncbi:ParA family protein [Zophobihabitans entericus]|uniref:ParA family protein n=1 Tax=Zophobihabitans entericus TaxID=1635327 RepID=A0A6G9IE74_9GAMM|nr:ParA family protein [Zophobihabitans entericus]QIQ22538.1 ParA family protein [Zophobihabitans entericus]